MSIEDDGAGFAVEERPPGRLGLVGIRERIEALGGTLEIESAPGQGTTVLASVDMQTGPACPASAPERSLTTPSDRHGARARPRRRSTARGRCRPGRTPERIHAMWPEQVPDVDEADQLIGAPQLLANTVYAGRYGNGDAASRDGWRYRGRGLIRLLGRAAYREAGNALKRPYEQQPELVAQPREACLVAAWLWQRCGLNELADRLQVDAIARRVREPAAPALGERRALYRGALAALHHLGSTAHSVGTRARGRLPHAGDAGSASTGRAMATAAGAHRGA